MKPCCLNMNPGWSAGRNLAARGTAVPVTCSGSGSGPVSRIPPRWSCCGACPTPLGSRWGPDHDPKEIRQLCRTLNPLNEPGRICLITRFGRDKIHKCLPRLIREIKAAGCRVVWISDPMHGNTFTAKTGYKTRRYDDIFSEIKSFFTIHAGENTIAGGLHLEMSGQGVTECTGGSYGIRDRHLEQNYQTTCDPRLNEKQCLELALDVAEAAESFGLT